MDITVITELRVTIDGATVAMFAMMSDVLSSRVRKHRLGDDDVPFIKIEKNRGPQTNDGAPNREP